MGNRNSLRARILAENPQTFIAGCNCHLAHLAAGKSGEAYTSILQSLIVIITKLIYIIFPKCKEYSQERYSSRIY